MKSRRFKWEHRSQETRRQQEAVITTAMEARRKEEEWVRDWRRHTTIRQHCDQNLHLELMKGHGSLGGREERARRAWVPSWVPSSSSQIDLAPSTRSFKHLPCDNQPKCVADISRMRWLCWTNKERTKSTMYWWWNGLTLPLLEVAVCTLCKKWFLKVGCDVAHPKLHSN